MHWLCHTFSPSPLSSKAPALRKRKESLLPGCQPGPEWSLGSFKFNPPTYPPKKRMLILRIPSQSLPAPLSSHALKERLGALGTECGSPWQPAPPCLKSALATASTLQGRLAGPGRGWAEAAASLLCNSDGNVLLGLFTICWAHRLSSVWSLITVLTTKPQRTGRTGP